MRLLNLFALTAVFVTSSFAVEQINWFSNGFTSNSQPNLHTGTITYSSLAGKAVGTNIDIDVLQGLGLPANNNIFVNCFSCTLSFVTGNNTSDTSGTTWSFGSTGSSITVKGGFDLNNNGVLDAADIQPGTTLLSGVFNSPITVTTPVANHPDLLFAATTLINVVNTQLANFYGVPGGYNWNGDYSQTIDTTRTQFTGPGGAGHYRITTVAMRNGVINDRLVVPEPTDLLLGSSVMGILVGGVVLRRRRLARQA